MPDDAPGAGPVSAGAAWNPEAMWNLEAMWNPAVVDPRIDSRAVSFEHHTGGRGGGGAAAGGRKGSPSRRIAAGGREVLADIEGPGQITHLWMTFLPGPPELMRALQLLVYYDGAAEPSIAVPCLDFFGLPHGRPVAYHSAVMAANEGRGFNSYLPMPFRRRIRIEVLNAGDTTALLYYQADFVLLPDVPGDLGYLHTTFRRQNPTVMRDDFVIAAGLAGPGRFLGCNVGVRVIDHAAWYGEGEVKVYRDGDTDLPTICGTGLEDYVGSAWGLGAHSAPLGGAPLVVHRDPDDPRRGPNPDYVGFYRWHLPDPIMYEHDLRVTIQQIGAMSFAEGHEDELEAYERTNPVAGNGWIRDSRPGLLAWGLAERVDDYCATAYLYCLEPQPVEVPDIGSVLADIGRLDYERPAEAEVLLGVVDPSTRERT